ncbi:MAG TPA: argininosuccinate lyase [Thermoanaerobaculia bacterium]|nr:argininosuccinate lyase [Thermoanaerobaculia bacterium]
MTVHNMWGGRFSEAIHPDFKRLNESLNVDYRLLAEDLKGSIAWAESLQGAGVFTSEECREVVRALQQIPTDLEDSDFRRQVFEAGHEDVHSLVEELLRGKVGELAGKLHTGRSRNDQVATDLKMYVRSALTSDRQMLLALGQALARRAEISAALPMPGYTHLKRAEPVTFGHWCLAYVEMILRDADRLQCAIDRSNECPLGSAALAGTPLSIDRQKLAEALGFARPTANSIDAVSDRDFVVDAQYALSLMLVHLSRMAEDLIVFSTDEFGFVELPDALSTGSSRMPHKKNPDLLELVRGHAARSIGDLTGTLALLKGIPLSYNKDLQLDKEPLFRMQDVLEALLPALTALIERMKVNGPIMRDAASSDVLLATEVADAMSARGIGFRTAHEQVSSRVAIAQQRGISLRESGHGGDITATDLEALDVDSSLARKNVFGGTAPGQVARAAAAALQKLRDLR